MEQRALESYRTLENVIFLKKVQVFSAVQTSDLKLIAQVAEELGFEKGEEIVRENEMGDSMYIIKRGNVAVEKNAAGGPIRLATLSEGDCFGDMAVFDAEVRSASVVAQETCGLLRVKRDDLIDVVLQSPHIALGLLKVFIRRLRSANDTIEKLSVKNGSDS